jgi:hypothetical protein
MRRGFALVAPAVAGVLLAAAVAAAWIPVRERVPNTDLALLLVLLVVAMGATGRRSAVVATAVSAAVWFEFFDTRPFEQLAIARRPDIQTTLVLAVVGLITGELAVRLVRLHRSRRTDEQGLGSVRGTARLVANGEDLVLVIQQVAAEIAHLLDLEDCSFESGPVTPGLAVVGRDGSIVAPEAASVGGTGPVAPPGPGRLRLARLPVEGDGQHLGSFLLRFRPGAAPRREDLLVAVTLSDHVGAAFMAQAPPPPPPERAPQPQFRVVR